MRRSARSRAQGEQKGVIPMQPIMKVAAVEIVVALIAVIGLILTTGQKTQPEPQAAVAAATQTPEATGSPEPTENPSEATDDADNEAQADEDAAQDTMYEGALAGMTEEEIEKQALAEEAREGAEGSTND